MNNCLQRPLLFITILAYTVVCVGQSIFSFAYPFGLPMRVVSSTAHQMGGTSVGIIGDHHTMLTNPGNLGTINNLAVTSMFVVDYLRLKDGDSHTDHLRGVPRQISFAFPLEKVGAIGFALAKVSDASFKYRITDPLGRISLHRQGGSNMWQIGIGRSLGKWINLGLVYKRTYFTQRSTKITEISELGKFQPLERDSMTLSYRGSGISGGLIAKIKNFSSGISFSYFFEDKIIFRRGLYDSNVTDPFYNSIGTIEVQQPPSINCGVAYAISPKITIGTDLGFDLWQYYSAADSKLIKTIDYENTFSFSLGARFIPAPKLLAPKYWETMHYRAGVYFSQLPGNTGSEFSGSYGLGFPVKGNGLVDIGFEIGTRTDGNFSQARENFIRCSFGINGSSAPPKSSLGTY